MTFPSMEEEQLRSLFDQAVAVADPMRCLAQFLPPKPDGRVVVVGAGKASARMAEAVEAAWGPCEGLVITRYGYARPCQWIEIVEAAHPVPDEAGQQATARMLDLLRGCGPDDYILCLISGGASALLTCPRPGITLADKQAVNAALLASGAPIDQMNIVRKHLSAVKGGQLGAATSAPMKVLMISDVPGDDPADIGSGPTVADASTAADALQVIKQYEIELPDHVAKVLALGSSVIAPDGPRLASVENTIVAAPSQSLKAAAEQARAWGYEVRMLGDDLEGEAREEAARQAALARQMQSGMLPGDPPVLLLSGGECTVTGHGGGIGGPNAEFALALTIALGGQPGIHAIACDTDGVDGAAEVAGAVVGPETLAKARKLGRDPSEALTRNDSHSFFEALGDQVVTGPTLTNVNDFRAVLIKPLRKDNQLS